MRPTGWTLSYGSYQCVILLQALTALPCNPEIWINLIAQRKEEGASPAVIRSLLKVAVRNAGKAWDSANLWKFFAMCEIENGDVSAAVLVLLTAVKMPTDGQAELLEELRKYLVKYQPGDEVVLMEEAEPSQELLDNITCRRRFEEKLMSFEGSVTKAEIVTWKEYLDFMREQSIENKENTESNDRMSQVQALFDRCMDTRVFRNNS